MPAPAIGARTGMPRHRFDALWSALTFSQQPAGGGPSNDQRGGERYQWALINDFISSINAQREAHASPGDDFVHRLYPQLRAIHWRNVRSNAVVCGHNWTTSPRLYVHFPLL